MSPTETPTPSTVPAILTRAAETLTTQGWTQQGGYKHTPGMEPADCPLDLPAAIAKAAGIDIHSHAAEDPTGIHARAVMTLHRHVFGTDESAWWSLTALACWQDQEGRTAEQVIAALRAAAEPTEDAQPALPGALRPGQLYSGRDDDLLFCVAGKDGTGFVTNRGTWVPMSEARQVYAPLTLVRDVGAATAPPARELAAVAGDETNGDQQ
ncbi:hypothetical protein [Actinomadura sp. WMMA1423]|uniref:DUF6197 family protein n=1 Tax=Actinomadura sp. WMMA1423 TaxID=2591108 RepID=UPI0011461803|nr:hypothetical protein [Actinomadura sp. WMMA1423]